MQFNFNNLNIDWTRVGLRFAIQAVFLTLALWATLKQQKLAWKLPGLLGSVLLACALVQIPYAGDVLGFVVLLLCITKAIGARTFTDAIFAVGVAFVLLVVFNLVVLSMLVGVLEPAVKVRARVAKPVPAAHAVVPTNEVATSATTTNSAPVTTPAVETSTNTASAAVPAPQTPVAAPASIAIPATNTPATPVAPAPVPARPPEPVFDTNRLNSARLAGDIMKHYFVKGVSQGATMSIAMISDGTKNFDVIAGDFIQLETSDGKFADVKCESISEGRVVISVDGVAATLLRR